MGYSINKVIIVRLSNSHIPYLKGILIDGPKGGKYLLDEFNSEILVRRILNDNIQYLERFNYIISNMYISFGRVTKKMIVLSEDVPINKLGNRYEAKTLVRKDGIESIDKMHKDSDFKELKEFIINY